MGALDKLRDPLGSTGMLITSILLVALLIVFKQIDMLTTAGMINLLITAVVGGLVITYATKSTKDKPLRNIALFLTVLLVSLVVTWLIATATGLFGA